MALKLRIFRSFVDGEVAKRFAIGDTERFTTGETTYKGQIDAAPVPWFRGRVVAIVVMVFVSVALSSGAVGAQEPPPEVKFSHERGVYDGPFQLSLSAPEGSTIIYTTDGSIPSSSNGSVYNSAIQIDKTTIVRAYTVTNGVASLPDTRTFVQTQSVLTDPKLKSHIMSNPAWANQVDESLLALPMISLVSEETIQRVVPVSFEYFDPATGLSVQRDAASRKFGWGSMKLPKNNMRVYFNADTGGNLKAPLFEGYSDGITPVKSFDKLDLRSSHDTHALGKRLSTYVNSRWLDWAMLNGGTVSPHGRYTHVYLNGTYWGVYLLRETFDDNWLSTYYGGPASAYDYVTHSNNTKPPRLEDGDGVAWENLLSVTRESYAAYKALPGDENSIFDMAIHQSYGGHEPEWNAAGSEETGFVFNHNDADRMTHTSSARRYVSTMAAGSAFGRWVAARDDDFLTDFGDRLRCVTSEGGSLHGDTASAAFAKFAEPLRLGLFAEFARWSNSTSYTMDSWSPLVDDIIANWTHEIGPNLLEKATTSRLYPETLPVNVITAPGTEPGSVVVTLTPTAPPGAAIYYTVDGTDPRLPGGALSATALLYDGPVGLPEGLVTVRARVFDASRTDLHDRWSASCPVLVEVGTGNPGLVINEISYHPGDPDADFEFIELLNNGTTTINLDDIRIQGGIRYHLLDDADSIAPGEFFVLTNDPVAFAATYGTSADAEYDGSLSNGGEDIEVKGEDGRILDRVVYDDAGDWPTAPDGKGPSLELRDPDLDNTLASSWAPSAQIGGTPGEANSTDQFSAGDIDCNGTIDTNDVRSSLTLVVGLTEGEWTCPAAGASQSSPTANLSACDVTRDGTCDLKDAVAIAQCLTGTEPTATCLASTPPRQ